MNTLQTDLQQQSDQHSETTETCAIWGDEINKKNNNKIRICFQNINGFGYNKDNKFKSENIRELMETKQIDIMAMAEINVNWRKVQRKDSIWNQTRSWFEHRRMVAKHNILDKKCRLYQPGGTAIITQSEMALRHMESGGDTKRLGRWSWVKIRGKNDISLRIVSVYVPHLNKTHGHLNVYAQHQDALLTMGIAINPIKCFWEDFWAMIDECIQNGEQLIIAGDWNTDVRKEDFTNRFLDRNLVPAITESHGKNGPETYNRGSNPIDEIFISANLDISACGYLEHGINCSDHRPIWIDIVKTSALGSKLPPIPFSQARRLKTKDPRIVARYTESLDNYLQSNNFYLRMEKLAQSYSTPLSTGQQEEYEKLDMIREIGMKRAEKKCRHIYLGNCKWSPIFQLARLRIQYFKLSLSRIRGCKVNARTLIRLSQKVKVNAANFPQDELVRNLVVSFGVYKKIKQKHEAHRNNYIEELAEAKESNGEGKKAGIIRSLLQIEAQRDMFRRISHIMGKANNNSTTHVSIINENGQKEDITDKQKMEDAIIEENIKKFHQTEPTCPFIQQPLQSHFGFYGEGKATKQVFEGTYSPPAGLDKYTKEFLSVCKKDETTQKQGEKSLQRTLETFSRGWEKMKEKTSSNGTLHFGHYKAATTHPSLIYMHYQMAEIPFRTGYSPKRWRNATNVMILKKSGIFDLNKLRTIVLFEADFNYNNKWLGRSMMEAAMKNDQLAKEQYSTPGKKSIDHALNRRLLFDLIRYKKSSLAMTSCDLKSCYDRIAHVPALLALRRLGIPIEPIQSMFKTIQKIQFTTRTAFGDSTRTFGGFDGNHKAPVEGMGQGNGSGPQVWAVVSSAMFEVMRNMGLQTHFQAPISQEELDICGFAFVDDTDLISALGNLNDPDATMKKMQEVVDCWEGVAKTTGGALAPDDPNKNWFYLIHFNWDNGKWSYGNMDSVVEEELSAKDIHNRRWQLKYIHPSSAQEMLGVFLAPDGNNKRQIEEFKKKTSKFSEYIRTGHLTRHEAWTTLTTVALKSIEYALPALTLTKEECTSVIWPLLKVLLPKIGISRTISRDVLYGPKSIQGIGLKDMYLVQGLSHITSIIEHQWKDSITGFFIKSNLEQLRLEIGENGNIFHKNYDLHDQCLLTDSWIRHTWKFATENNIQINDNTTNIPDRRYNDSSIMATIREDGSYTRSEIQQVNQCRIYLRAFTISDISESNGKKITEEAWWGHRNLTTGRADIDWPVWQKPSKQAWTTWRRILQRILCTSSPRVLKTHLGNWLPDSESKSWQWFEDLNNDKILWYKEDHTTWQEYKKIGRSILQKRFKAVAGSVQRHIPASTLYPVTILKQSPEVMLSHGRAISTTTETGFVQRIVTHKYKKWLYHQTYLSGKMENLILSIRDGTAIAGCDGSFKTGKYNGTAAWSIETDSMRDSYTGVSIVKGTIEDQNAYRSELTGILALTNLLSEWCDTYNILQGQVTLYCDGKTALSSSLWRNNTNVSPNEKHSDLISAIIKLKDNLPITVKALHIKAHQDSNCPLHKLSIPAKINTKVDYLAKRFMLSIRSFHHFEESYSHKHSFAPVQIAHEQVHHSISTNLYDKIATKKLHSYWQYKGRYNNRTQHFIDWKSIKKASNLTSISRSHFISKWSSHTLGVGKVIKRWQHRPFSLCPFCEARDEDTYHVFTCPHKNSIKQWALKCMKFVSVLEKIDTCSYAISAIRRCLIQWRLQQDVTIYDHLYPPDLRKVLQSQHQIGWNFFSEGLIATDWITYQKTYYDEIGSLRSPHLWASKLIRAIWNFTWSIWDERNKQLHNTKRIGQLEGRDNLELAIQREWQIGLGRLPAPEFAYLLSGNIRDLLKSSLSSLRRWLALVRNGRILLDTSNIIHDEFMTNESLRTWVGIIKLKDGKPLFSQSFSDG